MKYLYFAILLLPFSIFAQEINPTQKLRLGLSFAPSFSSRIIIKSDEYKDVKFTDVGALRFYGGLSLLYKLNEKIDIETGILVADIGTKIKSDFSNVNWTDPDDPESQLKTIQLSYHDIFLELPAKLNFTLMSKSRLKIYFGIGFSVFRYLNTAIFITEEYKDKTIITKWINRNNYGPTWLASINTGIGMEYYLGKKFTLKAEPSYKQNILPFKGEIKVLPYSVGINFGIYRNL